jgi:hypothetical protein
MVVAINRYMSVFVSASCAFVVISSALRLSRSARTV